MYTVSQSDKFSDVIMMDFYTYISPSTHTHARTHAHTHTHTHTHTHIHTHTPHSLTLYVCTDPAVFQICSGDGNMNIPQRGCSGIESVTSVEGQSVEFNIALTHEGSPENCNDQDIQGIEFRKDDSTNILAKCSNTSCTPSELNYSRIVNKFDITITLSNLTSGTYTAVADIRRPSNMMVYYIYKNFSLIVRKPGKIPPCQV